MADMKPRHAAALALVVWCLTKHDGKTQSVQQVK
jgi:hypothetical protein